MNYVYLVKLLGFLMNNLSLSVVAEPRFPINLDYQSITQVYWRETWIFQNKPGLSEKNLGYCQ